MSCILVASDLIIMLKLLIQYSRNSPSQNQYIVFFPIFLAKFSRFFTFTKQLIIGFPLDFRIQFKRFFIDQVFSFFPCFFIKFRKFFYKLNTHNFFFSFPMDLRSFFYQSRNLKCYILVRACVYVKRQL